MERSVELLPGWSFARFAAGGIAFPASWTRIDDPRGLSWRAGEAELFLSGFGFEAAVPLLDAFVGIHRGVLARPDTRITLDQPIRHPSGGSGWAIGWTQVCLRPPDYEFASRYVRTEAAIYLLKRDRPRGSSDGSDLEAVFATFLPV
ncbi:MAG: hypothetical protein ABMB14_34225 [Myxococcota bacterium]